MLSCDCKAHAQDETMQVCGCEAHAQDETMQVCGCKAHAQDETMQHKHLCQGIGSKLGAALEKALK
jgi:hypothetical protein